MKILLVSLLLFINVLFASELEKVSLQLHWKYQFEFAGFIMAKEKGFYENVGLDVELKEYQNKIDIVNSVILKNSTYGIYNSNIVVSYLQNKPIKLLASFFKKPALVVVTQPDIKTPQDLVGKTVMTHSKEDFNFNFRYMFNKEDIDTDTIHFKKHSHTIDEFAKGEVDALSAFVSDELYKLDKKDIDYNVIDPSDYGGLYNLQLELFTSKFEAIEHPKRAELFKQASIKGWEYALNHKKETIDIIYKKYSKHLSKDSLKQEAKIIERLILPNIYKIGYIDRNFLTKQFEVFMKDFNINNNSNIDKFIFFLEELKSSTLTLSTKEKNYLQKKEILTACIDKNWMPFEAIKEGKHIGLTSDYLKIFEEQLNIPIKIIPTNNWTEALKFSKQRICDIVPLITKNEHRAKFLNFTKPLITLPIVIATKFNATFIIDFKSIKGKKIGVPKNYTLLLKKLDKRYPYLNFIEVPTVTEGMQQVKKGEIYGVIGSVGVIGYMVQRKYSRDLKINGTFDESLSIPMGIRADEPLLVSIFQNLIDNVTDIEHDNIFAKWIYASVKKEFDYTILYQVSFIFFLILSTLIFFFNKQRKLKNSLSNLVEKKTSSLKEQNNKLHHLLGNFQDLLDATLEVIIISDENNKIIDINKSGIELFNIAKKEEMIGMSLLEILPKSETARVMDALQNSTQQHYELTIQTFDGRVIPILAGGKDSMRDGKKIRISSIIEISELKKKDEQLLQQAKLAQMGEMVSMIAHQWRQPLNAISAASINLSLLSSMKMLEDEKIVESSSFIQEQCQKMSETINTFMNFVKPSQESKIFQPLNSMNAILNIMGTQLENHNIIVKIKISQDNIEIIGHEDLLEQVIINILSNARDAFEEIDRADKYIDIEINIIDKLPTITIKDNAGGIPEDIAHKIFNPYFTTKEQGKGTGIGLYMSKDIMQKSFGGDLIYKPIKNGSCFEIVCGK